MGSGLLCAHALQRNSSPDPFPPLRGTKGRCSREHLTSYRGPHFCVAAAGFNWRNRPFHVHVAHQSLKKLFTSECLPTCKDKYYRTSHSPCGSEEAKGKGEEAVHLRPAPAGHTCETGWWVVSIESKTPVCLLRDATGLFPPFACHNIQIRQGGEHVTPKYAAWACGSL